MKSSHITIGNHTVGEGLPVFVIAEIGINHNGSLDVAKKLIEGAKWAGCDAVKFQKRTPEICVPKDQWNVERDTPWGRMTYLAYRHRVEFTREQYEVIDRFCKEQNILWFSSCWDPPSVDFMQSFDPPCYKVASASVTDLELLSVLKKTGKPIILSTGMSTLDQVDAAINVLGRERLLLAHTTSTYPCPTEELNLKMITTLRERYAGIPIGYSGHEVGLSTSWAAVALGATFIERHITLDRAMWGSDQAASVELPGMMRLVSNIRDIEVALGDGVKRVYPGELKSAAKLRRVTSAIATE